VILAVLLLAVVPAPAAPQVDELELLLDAIRVVETGGEPDGGRDALGDQGRSLGPFQIQRSYWLDSGVPGSWEDCREASYARRVVHAYWRRYAPQAYDRADAQVLARVHNGGPAGARSQRTLAYWAKVEREIVRVRGAHSQPIAERAQARGPDRVAHAPVGVARPRPGTEGMLGR